MVRHRFDSLMKDLSISNSVGVAKMRYYIVRSHISSSSICHYTNIQLINEADILLNQVLNALDGK